MEVISNVLLVWTATSFKAIVADVEEVLAAKAKYAFKTSVFHVIKKQNIVVIVQQTMDFG